MFRIVIEDGVLKSTGPAGDETYMSKFSQAQIDSWNEEAVEEFHQDSYSTANGEDVWVE